MISTVKKITAMLMALAFFAVSCKKEVVAEYKVSPNFISVIADGETKTFAVKSNADWTLEASESWISLSAVSGSGSKNITVTVAANESDGERNGQICLKGTDGLIYGRVSIKQEAPVRIGNIIIAHRGAWKEYGNPDNSAAALQKAVDLGFYGSECDINITSDGQVIIIHGESFGGVPVLGNTYEKLKSSAKLANGETLPLLSDFLKIVKAGNGTKLVIDVKSLSDAAGGNAQSIKAGVAAAKLIKEMGAQDRVAFIIGRYDVLNGVAGEVGGQWPVGYMNSGVTPQKFLSLLQGRGNWGNFDISSFGKSPQTGKFDAAYTDSQLKIWNDAGVTLSFYNIDTEDQIQWYLPHKDNVVACTNYPTALLERVRK